MDLEIKMIDHHLLSDHYTLLDQQLDNCCIHSLAEKMLHHKINQLNNLIIYILHKNLYKMN